MDSLEALRNMSIGMDALFEKLSSTSSDSGFPPYNLYRINDNVFKIELALSGYVKEDISISIENGILLIAARKASNLYEVAPDKLSYNFKDKENNTVYPIHTGIAGRWFKKNFQIADDIVVTSAEFKEGILTINLKQPDPIPAQNKTITIK
jgi:molecular chaperone IbpA